MGEVGVGRLGAWKGMRGEGGWGGEEDGEGTAGSGWSLRRNAIKMSLAG